jgi:hypothetical protein
VIWSVVTGDDAWADVGRLSQAEQTDLSELLIGWVQRGPPRQNPRSLFGLEHVFEDEVLAGVLVAYFADEASGVVGILRIRKR